MNETLPLSRHSFHFPSVEGTVSLHNLIPAEMSSWVDRQEPTRYADFCFWRLCYSIHVIDYGNFETARPSGPHSMFSSFVLNMV